MSEIWVPSKAYEESPVLFYNGNKLRVNDARCVIYLKLFEKVILLGWMDLWGPSPLVRPTFR